MINEATLTTVVDAISQRLNEMIERANRAPQFLQRNVKRKYISAQKKRFMTENSSEYTSGGWKALNRDYAERKTKWYGNYPGGGRKLLIATNRLVNSILALSSDYREAVGDRSLVISTTVPYAEYVDEERTVTEFTDRFYDEIRADMVAYLKEGYSV